MSLVNSLRCPERNLTSALAPEHPKALAEFKKKKISGSYTVTLPSFVFCQLDRTSCCTPATIKACAFVTQSLWYFTRDLLVDCHVVAELSTRSFELQKLWWIFRSGRFFDLQAIIARFSFLPIRLGLLIPVSGIQRKNRNLSTAISKLKCKFDGNFTRLCSVYLQKLTYPLSSPHNAKLRSGL